MHDSFALQVWNEQTWSPGELDENESSYLLIHVSYIYMQTLPCTGWYGMLLKRAQVGHRWTDIVETELHDRSALIFGSQSHSGDIGRPSVALTAR
jgi:hypothetical protein